MDQVAAALHQEVSVDPVHGVQVHPEVVTAEAAVPLAEAELPDSNVVVKRLH